MNTGSDLEIKTRIEIAHSAFNNMRKVLCSRSLRISLRIRLIDMLYMAHTSLRI